MSEQKTSKKRARDESSIKREKRKTLSKKGLALKQILDTMDLSGLESTKKTVKNYIINSQEDILEDYPSYHIVLDGFDIKSVNGDEKLPGKKNIHRRLEYYSNEFFNVELFPSTDISFRKIGVNVVPSENLDKKLKIVTVMYGEGGKTLEEGFTSRNDYTIYDVIVYVVPKSLKL